MKKAVLSANLMFSALIFLNNICPNKCSPVILFKLNHEKANEVTDFFKVMLQRIKLIDI